MIYISIKDNISVIKSEIKDRADLLVVTKTVEDSRLEELIEIGIKDIGENRVQNLLARKEKFGDFFNYHMIGRLQTNKVKYLSGWVSLIHSLDRLSLAKELQRVGSRDDFTFNCLVQLNISREDTKTGIYEEDLEEFMDQLKDMDHLNIVGFMTMAENTSDERAIREVFERAKKIFEFYKRIGYNDCNIGVLSMGMSNDYKIAVDNGATLVRIGSKIFK